MECDVGRRMAAQGKGSPYPPDDIVETIKEHLKTARELCVAVGFNQATHVIGFILVHWNDDDPRKDYSTLNAQLLSVRDAIFHDHWQWKFVAVNPSYTKYIDNDTLFGEQVHAAFPDSCKDICEAGNCLAAGCGTACVFHLMRAAEFTLRSLARDRQIAFSDKPLEEKEWGQILTALEAALRDLRNESAKTWSDPSFRDSQIRFYNEVIQEFRTFNEAWRRHLAHADIHAFYEPEDAAHVMRHVSKFMSKLATKISQQAVTPKFWDSV